MTSDSDREAFVRVQSRLAELPAHDDARPGLARESWRLLQWRDDEIDAQAGAPWTRDALDEHRRPAWIGGLAGRVMSWRFARGVVARVAVELPALLRDGAALRAAAPLRALEIYRADPAGLAALAAAPWLDGLEELELVGASLDAGALAPLAARVPRLRLREPRGEVAAALDAIGGGLRGLGVVDPEQPPAPATLARLARGLVDLELDAVGLDDAGLASLELGALDTLIVRRHQLTAASAAVLVQATRLTTLDLGAPPGAGQSGGLGDGAVRLAAQLPSGLVRLGLACQRLDAAAVARIVDGAPPHLRELDLGGNDLDRAALAPITRLHLHRLGLSGNRTGPAREVHRDWDGSVAEETFDLPVARALAAELGATWVY